MQGMENAGKGGGNCREWKMAGKTVGNCRELKMQGMEIEGNVKCREWKMQEMENAGNGERSKSNFSTKLLSVKRVTYIEI